MARPTATHAEREAPSSRAVLKMKIREERRKASPTPTGFSPKTLLSSGKSYQGHMRYSPIAVPARAIRSYSTTRVCVVAFAWLGLVRAYPGRGLRRGSVLHFSERQPQCGAQPSAVAGDRAVARRLRAEEGQDRRGAAGAHHHGHKGGVGETVVLTGQISAENEASLAFRIGGRIIERTANVGDRVTPDQVLAKLDPQNELNALRSAQAALSAAEGRWSRRATPSTARRPCCPRGFTTQALYDQAQQALRTAQSQVDNAEAQLHIAKDRVSLHAAQGGRCRLDHGARRRSRRSGAGRANGLPGRAAGRARRGVRRAGPGHPLGARPSPRSRFRSTDDPSVTARARVRTGRSAGRPGHPHVPGARQPDRSAAGDVPRRDGEGAHGARMGARASRFRPAR